MPSTEPWPFEGLTPGGYGLIYIDPPWQFRTYSAKGQGRSASRHYATMSHAELLALPVGALAARDAVCVIWTTSNFLPRAQELLGAWGFRWGGLGSWTKLTKRSGGVGQPGAKLHMGMGYDFRDACEPWIYGKRGQPRRISRAVRNAIVAPVREPSRKPDEMRASLEALWPGPRCELFARCQVDGWASWGNETDKFSHAT